MSRPILDELVLNFGRGWLYDGLKHRWPACHRPAAPSPATPAFRAAGHLDLAQTIFRLSEPEVLQCLMQDPDDAVAFLLARADTAARPRTPFVPILAEDR